VSLLPVGDRILIRPDENPTTTESGLHLVEHRKPETMGEVIAVPSRLSETCPECGSIHYRITDVKVGDTVAFSWQSGQEVFVEDERYFLMREADILAIVQGV
jgi:co-chaperonin GroES (HSP10)